MTSAATIGSVTSVVSTTGTVNPELTIIVGSYVSGVIKTLYCDYNTEVKTGQVCAKIDPRPYQTAVDQAKANLEVGKAQLQKDQASLTYAKVTYDRYALLVKTNAVSLEAFDNARSTLDQAQAQLVYDEATIEQRQAELDAAQVSLDYTDIVSPVDGTVVSRNVTIGQTVAASFQTPTLFLIASDLTKMQVDTNVSEGDIGGIKLNGKVLFSVDAFPNREFEGGVTQIRQSPQTVQNVVTYDVVVSIGNADLALKPGMTAAVRIVTDQHNEVLRIPSQALRYTPETAARSDANHPRVWVVRGTGIEAVDVEPGLTDDDYVEVRSGDLKAGDEAVRRQIESLGTNLFVVVPGATALGGMRAGFGSASTLTKADVEAIRREASAVGSVSYLIRQSGQIQYMNRNWTTTIQGVSANYPPITNWRIADGRGITVDDDRATTLVAVIGQSAFRQLFPDEQSPVGATIQVRSMPLRIIGLLAPKGQTAYGQDQDDVIMVPFTTAERKILGVAAPSQNQTPLNWAYPPDPNPYNLQPRLTGFVNQIYVQATSLRDVPDALSQVDRVLTRRHNIRPGQPADFAIRNLSQIAETAEGSSRTMSILLAAVASISLLVGGIGIMNILLVSVTERTREIGLRMAIGARRIHVLLQFLAEAVFLSVSGGVAGILTGVIFSLSLPALTGWPAPLSISAILGGFVFSAAVGIFFGYYPARKAAHLNPIEALRYE